MSCSSLIGLVEMGGWRMLLLDEGCFAAGLYDSRTGC